MSEMTRSLMERMPWFSDLIQATCATGDPLGDDGSMRREVGWRSLKQHLLILLVIARCVQHGIIVSIITKLCIIRGKYLVLTIIFHAKEYVSSYHSHAYHIRIAHFVPSTKACF